MKPWLRSLAGRITIVIIAVATLTVLLTALLSFSLVRAAAVAQARDGLARQAQHLSDSYNSAAALHADQILGMNGIRAGVITSSGQVSGPAGRFLDTSLIHRILKGGKVSATREVNGVTVVLVARPLADGGGLVLIQPVAAINQASAGLWSRLLLALLAGLILAAAAGAWLASVLTRPLSATAASARLLASGRRSVPVPNRGPAEVVDVAHALAALDRALVTSEGRQREFLLSISHELRTPLTALSGYAEAMADGVVQSEDMTALGRTLQAETARLDRFVADLLELARLEADDFPFEHSPVDVGVVLSEAVAAWRGAADRVKGVLKLELPAERLPVMTDGQRLRQVIDSLTQNALRVLPAGAPLVLAARQVPGAVIVEVRDGGPGLSPDDVAVAFERGVLTDRYRHARPVGTGLGLSIAARLADRLGFSIDVGPAPEGGACFTVRIPLG